MDFDIKLAQEYAKKAKTFVANGGIFNKEAHLGAGKEGDVYAYGNAVAKRLLRLRYFDKGYFDTIMERSAKGIEKGLDFAPAIDYLIGDINSYLFMPRLFGPTINQCTLEDLEQVGTRGFERYFEVYKELTDIELYPDTVSDNNFMITKADNGDSHISCIDCRLSYLRFDEYKTERQKFMPSLRVITQQIEALPHGKLHESLLQDAKKAYNKVIGS